MGKVVETATLVIWGQDDVCSPPFYTDGYHRVFTDVGFRFIDTCGHFPQEEQPAETIAAMREFLGR